MFLPLRSAFLTSLALPFLAAGQKPDVSQIIQKSVTANQADFDAAPQFNFKETDRQGKGSKTYQVTMIEGTPYNRLIAINGKPLSKSQQEQEEQKQKQETERRRAESASDRRQRIAKYEKDRKRDHAMMEQLTKAFNFTYLSQRKVRGFNVWVLKAKPRPGYQPPNLETQVLPGMQGQLWIDQKTYQWVKVTAQVIRPVSIEGFLARVEPGTQFEMEMSPVEGNSWQISHFSMRSKARILGVINHGSAEDSTYFDYQRAANPAQ
ncbi:MAG TPA: hypothetical protein VKX25_15390 [Bryobacteraceae bacterium]|nr:hypothetical protein [Bryobacteraceae bacterium]